MKRATILFLEFLAGLAGNLVAAWIQQDIFSNTFTPIRLYGTILGAALMLALITFLEKNKKPEHRQSTRATQANHIKQSTSNSHVNNDEFFFDVFIAYAPEDRSGFVGLLVNVLQERGIRIWYDEFEIKIGDSLRENIDKGLSNSRFGVVILSKAFLANNGSRQELNGLFSRELEGGKVILPIWHELSRQDVLTYSPMLADKYALSTERMTIYEISDALEAVISTT